MWPGLKKTLKVLVLLLVVFVGGFFLANSIDEELNPEIAPLLADLERPVPVEGNAFFYVIGMWAGEETEDVLQTGVAIHGTLLQRMDTSASAFLDEQDYTAHGHLVLQGENLPDCGGQMASRCMMAVRENRAAWRKARQDNEVLLTRYHALLAYRQFREPVVGGVAWPGNVIRLHKLYLAGIAADWQDGRQQAALERLARAQAFWRGVATSQTSLLTHMFAVAAIEQNYSLLEDILQDCGDCRVHAEPLSAILREFRNAELSLRDVYLWEFAWIASQLPDAGESTDTLAEQADVWGWLAAMLYKPNTTHNSLWEMFSRFSQLTDLPPRDYLAARDEMATWLEARFAEPSLLDMYTNFVDSMLSAIAVPSYQQFYERGFALEDRRRLISVKWLLRSEGVGKMAIDGFLAGLDAEVYGSIVTGRLPHYDAATGTLSFDYGDVNPDMTVSVSL